MVQYKVIEMIWLNYFSLEDKVHRLIRKYPVVGRLSSAPFLNSDTYFFLCTIRIERKDDIPLLRNRGENSSVYVDGNFLRAHEEEFLNAVNASNYEIPVLFIGDTDLPPSSRVLYSLQNSCKKIAAVNSDKESEKVRAVPLGLESQRYRSAGQLRDFWNQPDLRAKNRKIGILVAWNDNTNLIARQSARFTLRKSPLTFEIEARVTARYVCCMPPRKWFRHTSLLGGAVSWSNSYRAKGCTVSLISTLAKTSSGLLARYNCLF